LTDVKPIRQHGLKNVSIDWHPKDPRKEMAVIKPRNRLVYFRVSEDEFRRFTQLCERHGSRSISDLVRDAMHRLLVEAEEEANGSASRVKVLDKLIAEVSAQLQQLASLKQREDPEHPPVPQKGTES
jgi:hypothetical protein